MTTVAPVSGPLAPVGAPPPTSGTPAVTTSSLLPPPVAENPDDLTALLLTQVQDRRINSQDAMRRVGVARERGRQLLEEARRSLERPAHDRDRVKRAATGAHSSLRTRRTSDWVRNGPSRRRARSRAVV